MKTILISLYRILLRAILSPLGRVGVGLFILHSCTPEDAPQNPCANISKTTAAFTMVERYRTDIINPYYWVDYDVDTIINNQVLINFTALQQNADSFIWQIGNEPTHRYGRTVSVDFPKTLVNVTLPITLIVRTHPNKLCYPMDDGIDTVLRYLTIVSYSNSNWVGRWRGYNIDQPDSIYDIVLSWIYDPEISDSVQTVKGLIYGCNNTISRLPWGPQSSGVGNIIANYKAFTEQSGGGTYCTILGFYLKTQGDSIGINYSILKDTIVPRILNSNSFITKTFIGKRH